MIPTCYNERYHHSLTLNRYNAISSNKKIPGFIYTRFAGYSNMYLQLQSKSRFLDLHLTSGLHDWDMNEEIKLTTTTDQFYHGKIIFSKKFTLVCETGPFIQCHWSVVVWQMTRGRTSIWRSGTTQEFPEDHYRPRLTGVSCSRSAPEVCSSNTAFMTLPQITKHKT